MQTCLEALTWPAANNSHPRAVVSNDAAEVQKLPGTQAAQNDQKIRDMQKKLLAWHAHPSNALVNICCKCVQRHLIHSLSNKAKKRARSIIQGTTGIIKYPHGWHRLALTCRHGTASCKHRDAHCACRGPQCLINPHMTAHEVIVLVKY